MTLFLIFLMLLLGLFAIFLGGGLVAQGYLYQNPAERMPLRAVIAAIVVAGFITLWVYIDQRAPGRYDTFFNFTAHTTKEFDEFEAVRWMYAGAQPKLDAGGKPVETTVKYTRRGGGKAADFVEEGTNKKFEFSGTLPGGARFMVGAIRVKGPGDPEPVRYNAIVKEDANTKTKTYTPERRFVEENGSRFVEMHQLGTLFVPSTGTVVLALLLNFMLVVVWLAAFWPILRFSLAHALIFTGGFALLTMIAVMPVLFKQNRVAKPPTQATALVFRDLRSEVTS